MTVAGSPVPQALVRGVIVAAASFLSFRFATRAAVVTPWHFLRLRIVALRAAAGVDGGEQVACGVLLAAAVVILRPRRTPAAR